MDVHCICCGWARCRVPWLTVVLFAVVGECRVLCCSPDCTCGSRGAELTALPRADRSLGTQVLYVHLTSLCVLNYPRTKRELACGRLREVTDGQRSGGRARYQGEQPYY